MDAHTHKFAHTPQAYVLSAEELKLRISPGNSICAGIHPWHVAKGNWEDVLWWSKQKACIAIGESGLDRLHPHWDLQLRIFQKHWDLSEEIKKPLVIHIVRASSDLLGLMKRKKPQERWLWHDFTGPLEAIPKILKLHPGMHFSCGPRSINRPQFKMLWAQLPAQQRMLETDDSGLDIQQVLQTSGVSEKEVTENFQRLFR
jgi:TatD DNase family protein